MCRDSVYNKHAVCLTALFIIGNTLIYFPRGRNALMSLFGMLAAFILSYGLYFLFSVLQQKKSDKGLAGSLFENFPKPFAYIVGAGLCGLALVVAVICADDYINYVDVFRLPSTPKFIIAILFLFMVWWLSSVKKTVLYKTALLAFIYVAVTVVVMFLLSMQQFSTENLLPIELKPAEIASDGVLIFARSFGSGIILLCFIGRASGPDARKIHLLGLTLGGVILTLCILNIVLIFGPEISSRLSLPYASAMSVISLGETFTRLEGFSYVNYYFCTLIKSAAAVWVVRAVADDIFPKISKWVTAATTLIIFTLCMIPGLSGLLEGVPAAIILAIVEVLFTILLFVKRGGKKADAAGGI